ncbi:hypothetical protein DSY14_25630 [Nocardiopsis sp. MG754419]|nr:hypothetical protein [Nocardiopsis sp. MG754419]
MFWGLVAVAIATVLAIMMVVALALNGYFDREADPVPGAGDQGSVGESPEPGEDAPPDSTPIEPAPTDEDGAAFSADEAVRYEVDRVHCDKELPGRSTSTGGRYCVVDLAVENRGEAPIDFGSEAQKLVTDDKRWLKAETPTATEVRASLWSTIDPGELGTGSVVFLLTVDELPESLELVHHPDVDPTSIRLPAPE